jgi:hypothetical protein
MLSTIELVKQLRDEIAQISEENVLYLDSDKNFVDRRKQERRHERLREIQTELLSLRPGTL